MESIYRSHGIKRMIYRAQSNIETEIRNDSTSCRMRCTGTGINYGGALSREGYNGGYYDALSDVINALNGVIPNRNGWWRKDPDHAE